LLNERANYTAESLVMAIRDGSDSREGVREEKNVAGAVISPNREDLRRRR